MKYIFFSLLLGIGLIIPQNSFAQTSDLNAQKACENKSNGAQCTYQSVSGFGGGTKTTVNGFCSRNGGTLSCNSNTGAWETCSKSGDACKSGGQLGVCGITGPKGTQCDTTKKPPGNPGVATSPSGTAGVPATGGDTSPSGTPGVPGTGQTSTGSDASAPQSVGFTNPIKFNSIPDLIAGIINALLGVLGTITVAILVMSGFKYMTSSNPGEVGQALDGIRNAVVGLMIIMGAYLITQYIISALV
jgi:hypothetical protein